MVQHTVVRTTVASIEQLDDFEGEYVYDIGMASDAPYFFANDVLVHNSCYFSPYGVLKNHPDYTDFVWNRDNNIALCDMIAEDTNKTFPEFMQRIFNTSLQRGTIIGAGRELVASKGLFIKKKKYAVLIYDKEGRRLDHDGPGKLKAMGLDLKRSDTPRYMQTFLEALLMDVLMAKPQQAMYDKIKQFRQNFKTRPGWEKGSPKKVADLTGYAAKLRKTGTASLQMAQEHNKVRVPGHVQASMNWNALCEMMHDHHATRISDGMRIIVCKLQRNSFGMTSVAYPVDEPHLPPWFKDLPFDDTAMEETIVDNKVLNLCGVLGWNMEDTKESGGGEFFGWQ